eukprot:3611129-Amphidinium_carterae.2
MRAPVQDCHTHMNSARSALGRSKKDVLKQTKVNAQSVQTLWESIRIGTSRTKVPKVVALYRMWCRGAALLPTTRAACATVQGTMDSSCIAKLSSQMPKRNKHKI